MSLLPHKLYDTVVLGFSGSDCNQISPNTEQDHGSIKMPALEHLFLHPSGRYSGTKGLRQSYARQSADVVLPGAGLKLHLWPTAGATAKELPFLSHFRPSLRRPALARWLVELLQPRLQTITSKVSQSIYKGANSPQFISRPWWTGSAGRFWLGNHRRGLEATALCIKALEEPARTV